MANDLDQELRLAKAARDEWMSRWQHAEGRLAAVWDDAIHSVRLRLGQHDPKCLTNCVRCWFYDELPHMLRGDVNNYVPIKERARAAADKLIAANSSLPKTQRGAYERGVNDILALVEKMLGDHE
jgi:hypothetical protein